MNFKYSISTEFAVTDKNVTAKVMGKVTTPATRH
jgi:hypothetical protein